MTPTTTTTTTANPATIDPTATSTSPVPGARFCLGTIHIGARASVLSDLRLAGGRGPSLFSILLEQHVCGEVALLPPVARAASERTARAGQGTIVSIFALPVCLVDMAHDLIIVTTELTNATTDDPQAHIFLASEAGDPATGALFPAGKLVMTRGALALAESVSRDARQAAALLMWLYLRHLAGDWSDMDEDDARANRAAVGGEARVLTGYDLTERAGDGERSDRVWVITEWDRSVTTVLTPDEY